jgi:hypothetical protein
MKNLSFLNTALILLTICYALGSLVDRASVYRVMRRLSDRQRIPGRTASFTAR